MTRTVNKEMGITHVEFLRLLPRALASDDFSVVGDRIEFSQDGKSVTISLGPEGERRIALMRMPTTPVTLAFDGYNDADVEAFLLRFDRAYQRGGG